MIYVSYENEYGKIGMGGGAHPRFNIREITGLGLPEKNYNTVTYAGTDGQETISETVLPRTITIGGDISGNLQHEIANAAKVLNHPGTLYIQSLAKRRRIPCRCIAFDISERRQGKLFQPFVFQFTADSPYFLDMENRTIAVFKRIDQITPSFSFPLVFTRRDNEADIVNAGDSNTEPIFYIYNTARAASTYSDEYGIEIVNQTTGASIFLLYHTQDGEVITIDIPRRKISSDVNGNIINCISDDTFLSDFTLTPGTNHITVTNHNIDENIEVMCEYSSRYVEAVY